MVCLTLMGKPCIYGGFSGKTWETIYKWRFLNGHIISKPMLGQEAMTWDFSWGYDGDLTKTYWDDIRCTSTVIFHGRYIYIERDL